MKNFDQKEAQIYERKVEGSIPGYKVVHQLNACLLESLLPEKARVLIIGAGTGAELRHLGNKKNWKLHALEPSKDMLNAAKRNAKQLQLKSSITFHQLALENYKSKESFDAATSILLLQFIRDQEEKFEFLKNVSDLLSPGGFLVLFDYMAKNEGQGNFKEAWERFIEVSTLEESERDRIKTNFPNLCEPFSEEELISLASKAGLQWRGRFFQTLDFRANLFSKNQIG